MCSTAVKLLHKSSHNLTAALFFRCGQIEIFSASHLAIPNEEHLYQTLRKCPYKGNNICFLQGHVRHFLFLRHTLDSHNLIPECSSFFKLHFFRRFHHFRFHALTNIIMSAFQKIHGIFHISTVFLFCHIAAAWR